MNRSAYSISISLLARREHSLQELRSKLENKGFTDDQIKDTLRKLIELDLQSEQRYAEMITRDKLTKGYGNYYIRNFLNEKGIADDIIEENLHDSESEEQSVARIIELILRRNYDVADEKAKCLRFLARRGFSYEDIYKAFDRINSLDE